MQLLFLALLLSLLHVLPTQTQVTLKYLDEIQMKDIRTKSAEFIHKQLIKDGNISSESVFDEANVGVSDIAPGRYYGCTICTPSLPGERHKHKAAAATCECASIETIPRQEAFEDWGRVTCVGLLK
jgi:hypothetical protein